MRDAQDVCGYGKVVSSDACPSDPRVSISSLLKCLLAGHGRAIPTHSIIGIMENKMEATIVENQMEKKMENEMETGIL